MEDVLIEFRRDSIRFKCTGEDLLTAFEGLSKYLAKKMLDRNVSKDAVKRILMAILDASCDNADDKGVKRPV